MIELAEKFFSKKNALVERALNQAARELLLAQASDWPFIMKTGTMVSYAERRIKLHINRFTRLYEDLLGNCVDEKWLSEVESRDNIFQDIDCAEYFRKDSSSPKTFLRMTVEKVN